ncbi:hypothetical protein F5D26_12990 [Burkholderia pseudomallei]|nr:hypothetical protein F5D26_12990 [Burkholderia pseudomallei]
MRRARNAGRTAIAPARALRRDSPAPRRVRAISPAAIYFAKSLRRPSSPPGPIIDRSSFRNEAAAPPRKSVGAGSFACTPDACVSAS